MIHRGAAFLAMATGLILPCVGPGSLCAQVEPPHPILSIPGSGSGASNILTTWTEQQYTNNFTPRLGPRNDDFGFVGAVVSGDTGWSWSSANPNQITSTPSGTVFPNGTYTVLTQAVTVMNGNMVPAPYYLRVGSSTARSLVLNLIAYHQRGKLRSDLNALAPAYMLSGANHAVRNQNYARRIAIALLDWARWFPNYTVTGKNSATFVNTGPAYILSSDLQRASDHNGLAHEWADDELLAFDAIYDSPALANLSTQLGFDVRGYIKTNLFCDEGDFIVYHVPPEVATDSNLSGPFTVLALVARVLNRPDYIEWMDRYLGITVREKLRRDGVLSEGMAYSIGYLNENENAATYTRDYFTVRPADTPQLQAISNRASIYVKTLTYGQSQWTKIALPNGQLPSFGDTTFNTYFSARNAGNSAILPAYGTVCVGAGSSSATAIQLNQNFSGDNNHMRSDTCAYALWAFGNEVLGNVRYHNGTPGRQFTEQILAYNAVTIDRNDMSSPSANTYGNGDLTLYEAGNNGLAVTEIDGQRAYANEASRYQRIMMLNSYDLNRPYVVDVFRVTGGTIHDYVWHGSIRYNQTTQCSFPLVTNTSTYPMLEPGETWVEPQSSGASFEYYGFWRNVNSNTAPGDFQITYLDADRNTPSDTKLWMTAAPNDLNVYVGRTPVPSRSNGEPANWWVNGIWRPSTIIRKRIPSGTLQDLFVSVIEPLKNGVGTIQSVERIGMNGSALESCALKITFTDGRVDTCVVNLRNPQVAGANLGAATISTTNGQFSLTGRSGVHTTGPAGSRVWLMNGSSFLFPGGAYAPTNLYYAGLIAGETRKLTGGSNDAFLTTTPLPTGTTLRGKQLSVTFGAHSGSGTAGISEMFQIDQIILTNGLYQILFTNDHLLEITNGITSVEQMGPLRTFTGTNQFEIALSGTQSASLPGAPAGLTAVPGNTRVLVLWEGNGAASYNVKRSTAVGGPYLTVASLAVSSFTDTNRVNGTTYYYVVSAVNSIGEGPNSAPISVTPNGLVPPGPGPIARYTFDDNTANDSSGHGYHGTLLGTAAIVTDLARGKVLSLDGIAGKVELGNPAGLNIVGECTFTAWVKLNAGMTGNHGILQRGHQSSPSREIVLRVGSSGTGYDFGTWSPSQFASLPVPAGDIGQGNWVHLAGTSAFNGSNYTYRLYRNGVQVATFASGPGLQNDFTVGWAIGARGGVAGFERVFNGYIDDLRIYGEPLSAAAIQNIMVGSPPIGSPRITGFTASGSGLVMSGTNGVPGAPYYVLSTTNVALPLTSWTRLATNTFDASGSFNFTNTIDPAFPQSFFVLQVP